MLIQSQRQEETPYVDSIYSQMSQDNAERKIGIPDFALTLRRLCLHVPANILKPTSSRVESEPQQILFSPQLCRRTERKHHHRHATATLIVTMGDSTETSHPSAIRGLQSSDSLKRLSLISNLRSRGVGDHIDLPQLVVSGDQSTGKSSVLEGITGIPFPRQDGLCTRFATEITMEHNGEDNVDTEITATIIPSEHRDEDSRKELQGFTRHLNSFHGLASVIQAAGELMSLKGYGTVQSGPAFGQDVLRIKVRGNTGLNLTIVDLPGIIQVPNDEQDDNDVDTVHTLADSYIANSRTIILAVVQAGNDISNQPIIKKSKKYDKDGERTIGVITKPDLINDGTQTRIAALSRNEDTTKLKLGFFMVKNPSPKELQSGMSMEEREHKELTYFSCPPWKDTGLDRTRIGVASLRRFLQDLLSRHTEREMPKVREEVRSLLKSTEKSISGLGEERPTTSHMRMFLSRLAMRYHNLTNAALIGDYDSSEFEFFSTSYLEPRRLRAFVHSANTKFSDKMRLQSATVKVLSDSDMSDEDLSITDLQQAAISRDSVQQIAVSDAKFIAWIKHVSSDQIISSSAHAESRPKGVLPHERARTAWQLQSCPSCRTFPLPVEKMETIGC